MPFHRETGRVTLALLLGFFVVGLAAAYWAVTGPDGLLQRGDNPRLVLADANVARGALLDRDGGVLAQSERVDGAFVRTYGPLGSAGLLGEVEGGFGVSGIEAAFDEVLRGEPVDAGQQALRNLLHQPRPGTDVRLTLDPGVQAALVDALGSQPGAAVVLSIPDGELLAMVSNQSAAEADAAVNGALQGARSAGGTLIPGLLSAALLQGLDITQVAYPAEQCAVRLPNEQLVSLQESFLFACLGPFETIAASMTPSALAAMLNSFAAAPVNGVLGALLSPSAALDTGEPVDLQAVTLTPLSAALMMAAMVNDGSSPAPVLAQATRAPGSEEWTPLANASPVIPVTTAATARRLQDLMRQAVAEGAAQNAGRARLDIGGLAALAGTDETPVSWFIGFTSLPAGRSAVVALVLDGQRDAGLAADIGGAALESAAALLGEE